MLNFVLEFSVDTLTELLLKGRNNGSSQSSIYWQRWSFHSQVFFLGKRLEHHRQLIDHKGSVVQDRTVYEDAEIFARNLYQQGRMSERDYDAYRRLYQAVSAFVSPP